MLWILFWISGVYRVLLHIYYSQVHSDPDWLYLLGNRSVGEIELFNHLLKIIISYLNPYRFVQIVYITRKYEM